MDISNRDKAVFICGTAAGIIIIGLALEGVQTYAAKKNETAANKLLVALNEYNHGILRGAGNARTTDDSSERSSDGPTAVPAPSLDGSTGSSTDILEPARTYNGVPQELRLPE